MSCFGDCKTCKPKTAAAQITAPYLNSQQFWVVWCEGGGGPTFKHVEENTARDEAHRLANENPGRVFFVLKAVSASLRKDETTMSLLSDDIPF